MQIEIDEKRLDKISHIEIRRRKDAVVVVEIPKGKTIQEFEKSK